MITFILSLAALVLGYIFYGRFVERVFGPDDRVTPAVSKADGLDYIVMPGWKIFMIQFLNIAGTGPIFGAKHHLAVLRMVEPGPLRVHPLDRYRLSRASEEELLDHAHPRPLHDHRLQHLRIHLPSDAPPARAIGLRPGHRLPRGGCRVVHNMV